MMRIFILPLLTLALTACGFKPLHATSQTGINLSDVGVVMASIQDVQDREAGYYIQQRLLDRTGNPDNAKHVVTITPSVRRTRLGVTNNDVASRYDINLTAKYTLTDRKTGKVLDNGQVRAVSTFGAPDDAFGLIAADTNGTKQGAQELADRLLLELATYYSQEKARKAAP